MRILQTAVALVASPILAAREVSMPEFQGIIKWLNIEKPLTAQGLKGTVILIDFWTYTCINCIRTLPHVRAWHEKYKDKGFNIVGVHTPEFDFEKEESNVRAAIEKYNLGYPVAMDNDYKTWRAYSNRYWPAHYLFDAGGVLRYKHFGEGNYEETENMIRKLIAENGVKLKEAAIQESQSVDFSKIKSPEMYLGYERVAYLGNPEKIQPDKTQGFSVPKKISRNKFYLEGQWKIASQHAELISDKGKILVRFHAGKVNLVMSASLEVRAELVLNGKPAGEIKIRESRLYELVQTKSGDHTLEIRFLVPGVKAYAFTYGS